MAYDENNVPLCMTTILKQEMERFNTLLSFIKSSLQNIALAIKGDVILSQDLEDQYKSLYIGKVPAAWNRIAYPSLKPLSPWFDDLILRVKFMHKWLTEGPPKSYWISGLYFPQGFVTALLQTHSRKYKISIDTLKFDFQFSNTEWSSWEGLETDELPTQIKVRTYEKKEVSETKGKPSKEQQEQKEYSGRIETSVWVHGLFLDCGFFNLETGLLEASREGILYPKLPYVRLIPVETDPSKIEIGYTCPVYKTS